MFAHLSSSRLLRAAAYVPVDIEVVEHLQYAPGIGGLTLVFTTTARTVGACGAIVQGSNDGDTWFMLGTDETKLVSTNGCHYLKLLNPIPTRIRIVIGVAGGFDGKVEVVLRGNLGKTAEVYGATI